jgi:hypothetical protein
MDRLKRARKLLEKRGQKELSELLKDCHLEVPCDSLFYEGIATIRAPVDSYEQLAGINDPNRSALVAVLQEVRTKQETEVTAFDVELEPQSLVGDALSDADLLEELDAERMMMVSVSTGQGPRINEVNEEYTQRREHLKTALRMRGIADPNPYPDLWAWYHKWSSGDLKTYQSRREHLAAIFTPALEQVKQLLSGERTGIFAEPTGWTRVDRAVAEVTTRLLSASSEEHFQTVGLLCREALISVAQMVFDPARHKSTDGVTPSTTDGKRMLEAFIAVELEGAANEIARRHAKALAAPSA